MSFDRFWYEDIVGILVKSSLRGSCMILCRSSSEDLVEILVGSSRRSLHELRQVLIRRYCGDPGEVLSKRFLAWSCTCPYGKILWRSCWHPLRGPCMSFDRFWYEDIVGILVKSSLRGSCMILCRSLSEDLVEILVGSSKRSLHELRQVLIRRYCGDPGEVLSKRFLHDLVQVLVGRSCGDPGGIL